MYGMCKTEIVYLHEEKKIMNDMDFMFGLQLLGLAIVLGWIVGNILLFICTLCTKVYELLLYLISILITQMTETKRHRKKRQSN